jgi:nucleoside 2-deoxyribosyltransferase
MSAAPPPNGGDDLMHLYFAGPLFNANEVAFNARLAAAIEALGYQVFLPQRDGHQPGTDPEVAWTTAEAQAIFDLDRDNLFTCDVLLCILDGRVPDEGMAVELVSPMPIASITNPTAN